ncbi:helix-turn-helix transcriptional regulator [Streptomyces sp. NBC_01718]|uniref:helix-turn-helix transcriptional regulator n=1 Tax=Streptomyces sp. NBC_01718 TaxID=2975919 RepID=UPI00352C757D
MEFTWEGSLRSLGISEAEERVYRIAVTAGTAVPGDIADRVGLEPEEITAVLDRLRAKGLMAEHPRAGGGFVPAAPDVALSSKVLTREHELHQARLALADLTSVHRARARGTAAASDALEIVTGAEAVGHWFRHLHRSASDELLSCTRGPYTVVHVADNGSEVAALNQRGISHRGLIDRSVLADVSIHEELTATLDRGQEIRVVDELPVKMLIIDRSLAMVPLDSPSSTESCAVIVRRSGLLDALLTLFEQLWAHGVRLRTGLSTEGGAGSFAPDPLDRRILALLLSGHTDEAAGKQLGMARRTVQRRVSALMEAASVQTRLQLGWAACDRGWI